ncbi:MAG: hypothetical protein VKL59_06860 [Nostocaceae cyanobacterium]|nr:hypothetical protein [Nostocaceae cyanobacterium]
MKVARADCTGDRTPHSPINCNAIALTIFHQPSVRSHFPILSKCDLLKALLASRSYSPRTSYPCYIEIIGLAFIIPAKITHAIQSIYFREH